MFDDILGEKKKKAKVSNETLIKSLKYNVEEKEKMIKRLIKRITDLEKELEDINQRG